MRFFAATTFIVATAFTNISAAGANENEPVCYQLSQDGVSFSRTPELLCVEAVDSTSGNAYRVTLKIGLTGIDDRAVATFDLALLRRARCPDCNEDVYGINDPSNAVLSKFAISFHGREVVPNGRTTERGTVSIGGTVFYYVKLE